MQVKPKPLNISLHEKWTYTTLENNSSYEGYNVRYVTLQKNFQSYDLKEVLELRFYVKWVIFVIGNINLPRQLDCVR